MMTTSQPHLPTDAHFSTLDRAQPAPDDHALALRHAPRIRFDAREPFFPCAVGYTVFRADDTAYSASPSFPRQVILPPGAALAVEYAVWWDWDIQHLYELEHIWLYLDADERVVHAEASWHGGYNPMLRSGVGDDAVPPLEAGRLTLYSEPGKHAFAPVIDWLEDRAPATRASCGPRAGVMGVHVTPLFDGLIHDRSPLNNQLVHTYCERLAFEPSFDFARVFDLEIVPHVTWEALARWIPSRVGWWCARLAESIPPAERRFLRIAHRGASAYAQEGSAESVRKAAELGADMVEVDVRVTRDGVPVIAHDPDLRRLYGVDGLVAELTLDEIRARAAGSWAPMLTFAEMVDLCAALSLGLYLDIKDITPAAMARVAAALDGRGLTRYCIFGAFRPDLVAEIRAAMPRAVTSILFASPHIDPVALATAVNADYVHPCFERFDAPHTLIAGEWLRAVREARLGVICWHEERPEIIAALQALGVDGVCSDQPELLVLTP